MAEWQKHNASSKGCYRSCRAPTRIPTYFCSHSCAACLLIRCTLGSKRRLCRVEKKKKKRDLYKCNTSLEEEGRGSLWRQRSESITCHRHALIYQSCNWAAHSWKESKGSHFKANQILSLIPFLFALHTDLWCMTVFFFFLKRRWIIKRCRVVFSLSSLFPECTSQKHTRNPP